MAGITTEIAIYLATLCLVPVAVVLFNQYEIMDNIMFGLSAIAIVYILFVAFRLEKADRHKLFSALIMVIFSTLFWAFYKQNSGSLNLFAMRNVDMQVAGADLHALSVNNFLPPAWGYFTKLLFCLVMANAQ